MRDSLSQKEKIIFLEQWLSCVEHGLTTKNFCLMLVEYGSRVTKKIGERGLQAGGEGSNFTDILLDWFPAYIVNAIRVSEQVGNIHIGITAAISELKNGQNIIHYLLFLLWFPFCLLIGFGMWGLSISNKILSSTEAVKEAGGIGQNVNDIVSSFGTPFVLFFVVFALGLSVALPRLTGRLRKTLDNWPLFSLYKTAVAASFLNTTSNLLACGLTINDAFTAIEQNSSSYLRHHIQQMRELRTGHINLGDIFDTGLLLPFEIGSLKMLGGHAEFALLLRKSGLAHEDNVKKRKNLMGHILPKAIILFSLLLLVTLIGTALMQLLSIIKS